MPIRTVVASLLSVSLVTGVAVIPGQARARVPAPVIGSYTAALEEAAAVLGLDGPDQAAAKLLTKELREAFERLGYGGSEELSLAEVRLTMGCEGNEPACLSEAGKSIGVKRLIYGELQPGNDGSYSLTLHILNVPEAVEETQTTRPLNKAALAPANISATATEIVESLFQQEENPDPPIAVIEDEPFEPPVEGSEPIDEPPKSGLVWGKYSPRPTWKWAGFGVGIGLTTIGLAGAIGSGIIVLRERDKAFEAADASLTDCVVAGEVVQCEGSDPSFMENDVDPNGEGDLCEKAGVTGTDPTNPDAVVNAAVNDACVRGNIAEKINYASYGVGAAGLLLTIVFTTLLFVHKDNPTTQAMKRRDIRFGASPSPDGGFAVTGGFRF